MPKSSVSGDFAKLKRWADRLKGSPSVLRKASRNMADEALNLIGDGFKNEEDPYGRPWEPIQHREGKILQDTGRMRSSFHRVSASAAGFRIVAAVDYAIFHQNGTRRMVARRMVPVRGNLPQRWLERMREAALEALDEHVKG